MTYDIVERARRRTQRALMAAGAVALVLVLGLVLVLAQPWAGDAITPEGGAGSDIVLPDPVPGGDGLPDGAVIAQPGTPGDPSRDTRVQGVSWNDRMAIGLLPVSAISGPFVRRDGLAGGFPRQPEGAVMAAVHIGARVGAEVGPRVFEPTIADQVTGVYSTLYLGNVRVAYRKIAAERKIPNGDPLIVQSPAALRGYAVVSADRDFAVVRLNFEARDPAAGTVQPYYVEYTLAWEDGDWRLVAPENGVWVLTPGVARDAIAFPKPNYLE